MKRPLFSQRFSARVLRNTLASSLAILVLSSGIYFYQQTELALSYTHTDIRQSMRRVSEALDRTFQEVKDIFSDLVRDEALFAFFRDYDASQMSPVRANSEMRNTLNSYLLHVDDVLQVQFLRSDVVIYSQNATYTSIYNLDNAAFYRRARELSGQAFWTPTYDFTQAFGHELLSDVYVQDRYLISFVGEANLYQLKNGRLTYLPADVERPVLVISVTEGYLRQMLEGFTDYPDAQHFIVDESGYIVSHSDEGRRMTALDGADNALLQGEQGETVDMFEGEKCLISYVTLLPGWKLVSVVPERSIILTALTNIASAFVAVFLLALLLSVLLSVGVSRSMARPIRRLMHAIDRMGRGDFQVRLPATRDEFNVLMGAFNDMTCKIDTLIEENYNVRLREKENELRALRYQINPHFLYNAFNILHMSALCEGDGKTAELIILLSKMLRYVLRDGRDVVALREELENVRQYFSLMQVAYEDSIHLQIDAQEDVLGAQLPKLTLQPLVENAVQHGLAGYGGGTVRIEARREGGAVRLSICDNGRGLPQDYEITDGEGRGDSIGIANVRKRLSLLLGGEARMEIHAAQGPQGGTEVLITLPMRAYVGDAQALDL